MREIRIEGISLALRPGRTWSAAGSAAWISVVSNPRGYPDEKIGFIPDLVVDV
jgi:hypothetical protein